MVQSSQDDSRGPDQQPERMVGVNRVFVLSWTSPWDPIKNMHCASAQACIEALKRDFEICNFVLFLLGLLELRVTIAHYQRSLDIPQHFRYITRHIVTPPIDLKFIFFPMSDAICSIFRCFVGVVDAEKIQSGDEVARGRSTTRY